MGKKVKAPISPNPWQIEGAARSKPFFLERHSRSDSRLFVEKGSSFFIREAFDLRNLDEQNRKI